MLRGSSLPERADRRSSRLTFDRGALPLAACTTEQLLDNARAVIASILKAKPASAKGHYMKTCAVSSTMGPGFRVETGTLKAAA